MIVILASIVLQQSVSKPFIASVSLAEPQILCVEIKEGAIFTPQPYSAPLPAGVKIPHRDERYVTQGETAVGFRIGPKADQIRPWEKFVGAHWDPTNADDPSDVKITVNGKEIVATALGRKSLPENLGRTAGWQFDAASIHRLYLKLPSGIPDGASLMVNVPGCEKASFRTFFSKNTRTEGLRVLQTGYRPDDTSKSALFTLWMGSMGKSNYKPEKFLVMDSRTYKVVFTGKAVLFNDGSKPDSTNGDFGALAPTYELDFSGLRKPGTYRLYIPALGCSYPFEISDRIWQDTFKIAAKGFYFQRNGIKHEKKHGGYEAPRAFHEADGVKVYHSNTSLMDSGNGLNALGTDKDNFGNLVKGATNQIVKNTWGGYKDAGDWDSRIQHLEASRQLLELAEKFPAEVAKLKLNIPESGKGLPDVIAEAKWNIDHYKRLQTPEGGIRGGVEEEEHPNPGEASWQNSLRVFTYAPDPWCSWLYAASASHLSFVLKPIDPKLAAEYLQSAERAYSWGVGEMKRLNRKKYPGEVLDSKNFAAAWLYRLTQKSVYEKDFRATAQFLDKPIDLEAYQVRNQAESAALMARTNMLPNVTAAAKRAVLRHADEAVKQTRTTSLRYGMMSSGDYPGYGQRVSPLGGKYLIWAHSMTGDKKYLSGLLQAVGFGLGINPTNTVYTSGVGDNPTQRPFMIDPRQTGQKFPPGITVYGPLCFKTEGTGTWFNVAKPYMYPGGAEWPASETWYDAYWTIMMNEFTINQSMGQTAFMWGYLAYRR
jgi:endoglucanase